MAQMSATKDNTLKLLRLEDWIGNIANLPGFIRRGLPHATIGCTMIVIKFSQTLQGKEGVCEQQS